MRNTWVLEKNPKKKGKRISLGGNNDAAFTRG
jgi:hypothetical protein